MKLESRIALYNVMTNLGLLAISFIILFFLLGFILKERIYNEQRHNVNVIKSRLEVGVPLEDVKIRIKSELNEITKPEVQYLKSKEEFILIKSKDHPVFSKMFSVETFKGDTIAGPRKKLRFPIHVIRFTTDINVEDNWYRIVRYTPQGDIIDLRHRTGILLVFIFILLSILTLIGNKFLLKYFLSPLSGIYDKLKKYELGNTDSVVPIDHKNIDEFIVLDSKLNQLIVRVNKEFNELKEFSENASHELQTPLAVVDAKLETLLQSENLKELDYKNIEIAQSTLSHLAKMNRSLLLLNKISNEEFENKRKMNLEDEIRKIIESFKEIILMKDIDLSKNISESNIHANPYLIKILINNLLSNAIKYNVEENGLIMIQLSNNELIIKNTGEELKLPIDSLFLRFKKNSQTESSHGLGLAICKKICDYHGFDISYLQEEQLHTITVRF